LTGKPVPDGAYNYKVQTIGSTGQPVNVTYKSTGKVTGVNFTGGTAKLTIDGYIEAGADEVLKVRQ